MNRITGICLTVGLALIFTAQTSSAQNRLGLNVFAGSAFPTDEEPNSDALFGGGANFKYFLDEDHVAVGAGFRYYARSTQGNFAGIDYDLSTHVVPVYGLIEYYPTEAESMVRPYIGADVGVYTFGVSGNLEGVNFEPESEALFGVAPKAGLQVNVGEQLGVFGEVDYNAVFGKEDPSGEPTPTNSDFDDVATEFFSVNLGAAFRF